MISFLNNLFGKTKEDGVAEEKAFTSFTWCAVSDIGCCRPNNEDNYLLDSEMNLISDARSRTEVQTLPAGGYHVAGVFDGMGGGEAGELASSAAAAIFLDLLPMIQQAPSVREIDGYIRSAFLRANNAVLEYRDRFRMYGTTGTVAAIDSEGYKIYHLGDSRAYLLRNDKLTMITKDQTLAQLKMDSGLYDESDPCAEAEKHQLTEYIGKDTTGKYISPVEYTRQAIVTGDMLLLCSDGLYDSCETEQIEALLKGNDDVGTKADKLIQAALANGAQDNVTCILILFN